MYTVYCDGLLLHDPSLNDPAYLLSEPVISKTVNMADQFTFTIRRDHANFDAVSRFRSVIEAYDDGELIFRGRVLNDTRNWNNARTVSCEGDLAMLNDTVVRPYQYTGSVSGLLNNLIAQHNSQVPAEKQFTVGTVTVTDPNNTIVRSSSVYPSTWSELKSKLLDSLGGYLILVRSGSTNRLDYLADSPYSSDQAIVFGENLLDFAQTNKGEGIITALIPLGAKDEETGDRLTIKSVNSGLDYIVNTASAAVYGLIFGTEVWDDVTVAANLLRKGNARLAQLSEGLSSITLTALDLHLLDKEIGSFDFMSYVTVRDAKHGVSGNMLITKKTINLEDPSQGKITIGRELSGISEYYSSNAVKTENIERNYVTNQYVKNVQTTLQSAIDQEADKISLVVQETTGGGYVIRAAEIVESINETGSSVKISADHITLTGEVVVNAINAGSTTINGSKITTGTMNADRIGAGTIDASVISVTNLNASNIVSGELTVYDSNNVLLFRASKTNNSVYLAGLYAQGDRLYATETDSSGNITTNALSKSGLINTYYSATRRDTWETRVHQGSVLVTNGTRMGTITPEQIDVLGPDGWAQMRDGYIWISDDNQTHWTYINYQKIEFQDENEYVLGRYSKDEIVLRVSGSSYKLTATNAQLRLESTSYANTLVPGSITIEHTSALNKVELSNTSMIVSGYTSGSLSAKATYGSGSTVYVNGSNVTLASYRANGASWYSGGEATMALSNAGLTAYSSGSAVVTVTPSGITEKTGSNITTIANGVKVTQSGSSYSVDIAYNQTVIKSANYTNTLAPTGMTVAGTTYSTTYAAAGLTISNGSNSATVTMAKISTWDSAVTPTGTQTLTNKTLTSPSISNNTAVTFVNSTNGNLQLKGQAFVLASGTAKTITLTTLHTYLVIAKRMNNAAAPGLYIIGAHNSTNGTSIAAISAAANLTVAKGSGNMDITFTASVANMYIKILDLN